MVGILVSFWGKRPIFRCELLVFGSVVEFFDDNLGENEQNMYLPVIQGVKFFMEITTPNHLSSGHVFSPSLLKGHVLNHQVPPRWVEKYMHFH